MIKKELMMEKRPGRICLWITLCLLIGIQCSYAGDICFQTSSPPVLDSRDYFSTYSMHPSEETLNKISSVSSPLSLEYGHPVFAPPDNPPPISGEAPVGDEGWILSGISILYGIIARRKLKK